MKAKLSFAQILRKMDDSLYAKVLEKVPEWAGLELNFPSKLSAEQCSSSATARYKASLVPDGTAVADLTGGLGVDLWAFRRYAGASRILYNDMNASLVEAVRSNYEKLGIAGGSVFKNEELKRGGVEKLLAEFCPGLIFLDPARRAESGRKVFRIEDCSPSLIDLKDELLSLAPKVLVKLSPMADISQLLKALDNNVSTVHLLQYEGECKELLLEMSVEKNYNPTFVVCNCASGIKISFSREQAESAKSQIVLSREEIEGLMLYEPGPALLKSACYKFLSETFGMKKLADSTHLYISSELDERLSSLGKYYTINKVESFSGAAIKAFARENTAAELSARNLPVRTDELRIKMNLKPSKDGKRHIFACGTDFISSIFLDTDRIL